MKELTHRMSDLYQGIAGLGTEKWLIILIGFSNVLSKSADLH